MIRFMLLCDFIESSIDPCLSTSLIDLELGIGDFLPFASAVMHLVNLHLLQIMYRASFGKKINLTVSFRGHVMIGALPS